MGIDMMISYVQCELLLSDFEKIDKIYKPFHEKDGMFKIIFHTKGKETIKIIYQIYKQKGRSDKLLTVKVLVNDIQQTVFNFDSFRIYLKKYFPKIYLGDNINKILSI